MGGLFGGLLLLLGLARWYREDALEPERPVPQPSIEPVAQPSSGLSPRRPSSQASLSEIEPLPPLDLEQADANPHPFNGLVTRLSNGLELIVVEDSTTPTVAAQVIFRVGAAHDPPGQAGSAHLLEHLMFHGTSRLGTSDWEAEARSYQVLRELTERLALETDPEQRQALEQEMAMVHRQADQYGTPGSSAACWTSSAPPRSTPGPGSTPPPT